jgi:hypothetical protein
MFDAFKGCVVLLCDLFVTHACLRFENQIVRCKNASARGWQLVPMVVWPIIGSS